MNIKLFFLTFSSIVSILSIITICISPNINGFNDHEWRSLNCQSLKDQYDNDKNQDYTSNEDKDKTLKTDKKELNKCRRHKGMHDLEYTSLIVDLIFGTFSSILGLLHYLDVGKQFEKITGIIGLFFGIIGFVLTIIYVGFSGYIFNNEPSKQKLLFPNGAVVKKDGSHYVSVFNQKIYDDNAGDPDDDDDDDDDENNNLDPDLYYAKFKDLEKKQYNYISDLYKEKQDPNSQYSKCLVALVEYRDANLKVVGFDTVILNSDGTCEYMYDEEEFISDNHNKYLYDKWITSIIFSVLISACDLGLAFLGFLLFKNNNNYSS